MTRSSHSSESALHAPAERDSADEVRRKGILVRSTPLIQTMIDAMPGGVAILNDKHQIIAANRPLLDMLQMAFEDVLGLRLGEVFGCPNWKEGPAGCGTGRHCVNCGFLHAIQRCRASKGQAIGEWSLIVQRPIKGASLELQVKATATSIQQEEFIVCALEDVSSRKRLTELSTIFFHDVLNMVSGLQAHLGLLRPALAAREAREDFQRLEWLADQLADTLESQRDLTLAEQGDLEVQPQVVRTVALLDDLRRVYSLHPAGADRRLETGEVWDGNFVTDPRLLGRVLGNMLRNALEATDPGGTVTVSCAAEKDQLAFRVHNTAVIPEHLQQQLFHRSVTTKGRAARGIGTRSMKLLGEHYLQGAVSFVSRPSVGTIFTLRVPKVLCGPLSSNHGAATEPPNVAQP